MQRVLFRSIIRNMSTATAERTTELRKNYDSVCREITSIAHDKTRVEPRFVVVSKYKPAEDIQVLYDHGHRHFGENYVQELLTKAEQLPKDIQWHFIGALQSNKCKSLSAIPNLYCVETVDSESKANKLNNGRSDQGPKLGVFVQVNTSGEEQKAGISGAADIIKLAEYIDQHCTKLHLKGLMTIGSFEASVSDEENPDFTRLNELQFEVKQKTGLNLELSMGMSNDYAQAIRQGSTNVRVGSAIFGARKTKEELK